MKITLYTSDITDNEGQDRFDDNMNQVDDATDALQEEKDEHLEDDDEDFNSVADKTGDFWDGKF